jgi:hypothetical protein
MTVYIKNAGQVILILPGLKPTLLSAEAELAAYELNHA